jgi:membrane-bound metal-dependent hydrolase YbcI (DUF457 family)
MMGRSHAVSGLLVGCLAVTPAVTLAGVMPGPVAALAVAVAGGAALLPDIDHPSSTAARSLGWVTRLLARGVDAGSLVIYYATAGPRDVTERRSGHRLVTHTPVGAVTFGLLVTLAVLAHPIAGAVTLGLVCALLGLGLRQAGVTCLLAGAAASWWVTVTYPQWWWLWGVAVTVGAHVHREGDWCTNSGVPRRSWPRMVDGRRWDLHRAPVTFPAGGAEETSFVFPALCVATGLAGLVAVGGIGLLGDVASGLGDAVRTATGDGTGDGGG